MPSQRAADKDVLSFYVPRTLKRRLQKLAKARGETLTACVVAILGSATSDIELSADDYEAIAIAIREYKKKLAGGKNNDKK